MDVSLSTPRTPLAEQHSGIAPILCPSFPLHHQAPSRELPYSLCSSFVDAVIGFHTHSVFLCLHRLYRWSLENVLQRKRPSAFITLMSELGNKCYFIIAYSISCLCLAFFLIRREPSHPTTLAFGLLTVVINVEGLLSAIVVSVFVSLAKHAGVLYIEDAYTLMLQQLSILLAVPPSSFVWSTLATIPLLVASGPSSSTSPLPFLFTRHRAPAPHNRHSSQQPDSPVYPAGGSEDIPPTFLPPLVLTALTICFILIISRFLRVVVTVVRLTRVPTRKGRGCCAWEDLEAGEESVKGETPVEADTRDIYRTGIRMNCAEDVHHTKKVKPSRYLRRRLAPRVSQASFSVNEDGVDSENDCGDGSGSETSCSRSCTSGSDMDTAAYKLRLELDLPGSSSLDWNAAVFS